MIKEINVDQKTNNLIDEINKGFPHFWVFIIPVDLSYFNKINSFFDDETNLNEANLDLSVNIGLNKLVDDFINIKDKNSLISSDEDSLVYLKINNNEVYNSLKFINQQNIENNSFKKILKEKLIKDNKCLNEKEEKGMKKEEIININSFLNNCKNNPLKDSDLTLSQVQNYNINIYNPHINCVNICYQPSTFSPFSSVQKIDNKNNKILNNDNIIFNENEIMKGKIPLNLLNNNNQNIINPVSNYPFNNSNNNINMIMNNSFNNLGDNFPASYQQKEIDKNLFFNNENNNIKEILSNIDNKNEKNCENSNENSIQKFKKNKKKKKKKKKLDDEYTIEMFGRRGWICEGCNNFNYESRKNCNRCKIPKKPLKKSIIMDNNNGNKVMDSINNINHKDDWNCSNCGNINYSFRQNCNRCHMKKENSKEDYNEDEK